MLVVPESALIQAEGAYARIHVAFQGELGAYGEEAITQRWRGAASPVPSIGFADVVVAVSSGSVEYGILPVWNTIVGDIWRGRAALRLARSAYHGLVDVGEVQVIVRHQLLALPGCTLDDIDSVASHPVALAQCGRFLARHPHMRAVSVYDTAGAARDLATNRTRVSAAIASRAAAERYGLMILKSDIQDTPDNITRFIVLARSVRVRDGALTRRSEEETLQW